MKLKVKRPVPVWIAQILLIPFFALFLFSLFLAIVTTVNFVSKTGSYLYLLNIASSFLFMGSLLLLIFLAFWGMMRRKPYGRWCGVAFFSMITVISVVTMFWRPNGPMQYYEPANDAELAGQRLGSIMLLCFFGSILLSLIFSESVKKFFKASGIQTTEAPPSIEAYSDYLKE